MNENINVNEMLPKEQYTFNFEKNELKEIFKKQAKPSMRFFIICVIYFVLLILIWGTNNLPDIVFGILAGISLIYIIGYLRVIFSFRKSSKASLATMLPREYVYSIFDDVLKIEMYEQGNKIVEESRSFSEIQRIVDIKAHLLVTVVGRTFIIRKSELAENSLLLNIFNEQIKKQKTSQKRRIIILIICVVLGIALGIFGTIREKHTNDQAIENMKVAIEKTYDEYELLTWFNIHKDERFTDAFILVESDEKIDVLGYASQNGEYITVEKYLGMTPESKNVIGYLADGSAVDMRIYPNESDIPENVDIKTEFQYRDQTMYFCITFSEE